MQAEFVKCPHCGEEVNPLSKRVKMTLRKKNETRHFEFCDLQHAIKWFLKFGDEVFKSQ